MNHLWYCEYIKGLADARAYIAAHAAQKAHSPEGLNEKRFIHAKTSPVVTGYLVAETEEKALTMFRSLYADYSISSDDMRIVCLGTLENINHQLVNTRLGLNGLLAKLTSEAKGGGGCGM